MENVSKALMIAGGMLIAIMVISLIIVLWNQMSGYFAEQHSATIVEQIAEFNAQFENYNGKDIRGNELISVMNKVVNYNRTYSDMENYERIVIKIDLDGHQNDFKYNSSDNSIFPNQSLITNEHGDDVIENISNLSNILVSEAINAGITGINDTKLQKLSADIDNIVEKTVSDFEDTNGVATAQQKLEAYKEARAKKLKSILGYEVNDAELSKIIKATRRYYQYTQFKRAMFKCTGVQHNTSQNGRVIGMTFVIVEENGKAKFD